MGLQTQAGQPALASGEKVGPSMLSSKPRAILIHVRSAIHCTSKTLIYRSGIHMIWCSNSKPENAFSRKISKATQRHFIMTPLPGHCLSMPVLKSCAVLTAAATDSPSQTLSGCTASTPSTLMRVQSSLLSLVDHHHHHDFKPLDKNIASSGPDAKSEELQWASLVDTA